MNKQLRIGIPTALYGNTFGLHVNYIEWCKQFGTPVLLTPFIKQRNLFDILFLPGGADWSATQSNKLFNVGRSNSHLQWFIDEYFWVSIHEKKPIIGICAGMQKINQMFGGTLKNLYGEELKLHQQNKDEDTKNSLVHHLEFDNEIKTKFNLTNDDANFKNSRMFAIKVNSIHHQAVDKLGDNLEVLAKCGDVIEAIKHKELPIVGFQWHPEKIWDKFSEKVVKELLNI